jgi:hypothetical protein
LKSGKGKFSAKRNTTVKAYKLMGDVPGAGCAVGGIQECLKPTVSKKHTLRTLDINLLVLLDTINAGIPGNLPPSRGAFVRLVKYVHQQNSASA